MTFITLGYEMHLRNTLTSSTTTVLSSHYLLRTLEAHITANKIYH